FDWKADLLVVGSHGKGWAQRVLLGSVTERLINNLPTSLLVAPVGTAVEALWQLAQAGGLSCQLVHAISGARSALEMAGAGVELEEFELAQRARARAEIVAAIRNRVPQRVVDQLILREGRPASILNDMANDTNAHTLVLGGKHHSTLGRWLGGSTVHQVLRGTN